MERQGHEDDLLRAVKDAAAADYEILGEMGRGERHSVVYLARERLSQKLVALRLHPEGSEYELAVVRELDASVPAMGDTCPSCHAPVIGWGRFCSHCGKDLAGAHSGDVSRDAMLKAVRSAAEGEYEVLGEMERSQGGGVVYFAREERSARLVALRLTREQQTDGTESFALGVTQVIKPLVASLGATYSSSASMAEPARAPTAWPTSAPRVAQPAARSTTPPNVMVPEPIPAQATPESAFARERAPMLPLVALGALVAVGVGLLAAIAAKRAETDVTQDRPMPALAAAPAATASRPVAVRPESSVVAVGALPAGARRQRSQAPGKSRVAAARVPATPAVSAAPNCLNAYSDRNWTAALVSCTREASAGNQSAQRNLGMIYDQGFGVGRDAAQAAAWFRKAAATGNRDAAFQLATMYEDGRGVPQDQKEAIDWYRKAALLGDGDSQVKLGRAYDDGKGVNRDPGEAAAWYQRAADQGNLFALNRLGLMYADGKGVRSDAAKAVALFQSAAAKGDAQGQFNLATMYAAGRGVAKSDSTANDLYAKSAKQGYPNALKEAGRRHLKL
jgi:TPR repeat protein